MRERPLIVHVIHHLVMGGMENGLVNLINTMPESRYRHAIICIEDFNIFRERLVRPDVQVMSLYRSRIGVWRVRRRIFALCRQLRPTVLHSRNLSGLDALLPARVAGVPRCVHGEHGWDVDNLDGRKWKPALLRRLHAPLIDRFIVVSKDLERFLVTRIGISETRISQIYNGVDTDRFAPARVKPVGCLPAAFRGENQVVIGAIGRIQPVKDHETLVRGFARLLQSDASLQARLCLAIVGDGPLLQNVRQLAASLGVAQRTWFPGALDNVPELLRAFDVFVLPSLMEGISNTVLEAMASGLPVLATAVGGNLELVENECNGHLFEARNVEALAAVLGDYVRQPELRRRQGMQARRVAEERFGLAAMVRHYMAVYDGLCDGQAPV